MSIVYKPYYIIAVYTTKHRGDKMSYINEKLIQEFLKFKEENEGNYKNEQDLLTGFNKREELFPDYKDPFLIYDLIDQARIEPNPVTRVKLWKEALEIGSDNLDVLTGYYIDSLGDYEGIKELERLDKEYVKANHKELKWYKDWRIMG